MRRAPRAALAWWGLLAFASPACPQEEEADVPALIAEATRGDWNTRIKAVHALGRAGSIRGLSEGATDGDWQIRLTAVHWLGRQGDSAVPMLAHVTRSEPCRIIRLAAIHWLGSIGHAAVPALRATLGEESPMIRVTSSYWLRKLEAGDDDSADAPPPAADDPALLQGASAEDLRGCYAVNLPPTKVVPLAEAPFEAAPPPAAGSGEEGLAGAPPAEVDEWTPPKPKRRRPAGAKKRAEREKALELLSEAAPTAKPEPAAASAAEASLPGRDASTETLKLEGAAKAPEGALAEAPGLPEKKPEAPLPETAAAAEASPRSQPKPELGARPKGEPEPKLGAAPTWHLIRGENQEASLTVREPDPHVPPHDPLPDLLKALRSSNWRHRYRAADLLGMMGAQAASAVPDLIQLTKDKRSAVRASAALALGNIGPAADSAVPALQKCLDDRQSDVRYSAAVALGRMGSPAADRAFQRHVRSEAARMIDSER